MYSTISSKIAFVKNNKTWQLVFLKMEREANLQIYHASVSANRVDKGLELWV